MKKILILISFIWVTNVLAMDISWMYVQHRIYEDGRTRNRLAFGLIDENGHNLTSDENVTAVKLSDPQGRLVKLSNYKFNMDEEIYGVYDSMRSQWHFSQQWQSDNWFSANFSEPLISGFYRLKVIGNDGKTAEFPFNFKAIVALPVITSRSFRLHPDPHGNVIWKWEIPDSLGHMAFNLETTTKASIDIYKNNVQVAYFFIKLPSHMGYLFIPRNIVQKLHAKGNQFGLRVQLETRDINTRTYSDTLIIDNLLVAVPQVESISQPIK
jgi:hypothetical protein